MSHSNEKDQPAASAEAAGQLAGFAAQLPSARKDAPTLIVTGARTIGMTVNRAQLKTMFMQAGKPAVALPPSLEGAAMAIRTARAIRTQYGHCPVPVANTIQGQIQGPPPPTADNADCIVLTETPLTSADLPSGLDVEPLVEIALQLSGMSPNHAQAFQQAFDWKSTLSLSLPRGIRSYESVDVNGVRGMLIVTAARRGPSYALVWANNGMVFSLTGYGSSADAVPLAKSIH